MKAIQFLNYKRLKCAGDFWDTWYDIYTYQSAVIYLFMLYKNHLQLVDDWLCTDTLSLNIGKTNFMIISNRSSSNHNDVKIRKENIHRIKCAQFLGIHTAAFFGVQLDDQLRFYACEKKNRLLVKFRESRIMKKPK